jgi:hypothetical protein
VNDLLGFQLLINICANAIISMLFGFFFVATAYSGKMSMGRGGGSDSSTYSTHFKVVFTDI